MTELRIGERATYNGRTYVVMGWTAMSVEPPRVLLEDAETGDQIEAPLELVEREPSSP